MAYDSPNALAAGLQYVKDNETSIMLVYNFNPADSYAANVSRKISSADYSNHVVTISTINGNEKRLTFTSDGPGTATTTVVGQSLSWLLTSASEVLVEWSVPINLDIAVGAILPLPANMYKDAKQPINV